LNLYKIGIEWLQKYNLSNQRLYLNLSKKILLSELENSDNKQMIELSLNIINQITNINISDYNISSNVKENKEGYYMGWHRDDCFVRRNKKGVCLRENDISLSEKNNIILTHINQLPRWTILIYLSEYDVDYKGGKLLMVDTEYCPKKYDLIMFNSMEVHSVEMIKWGSRKNILLKLYEK
jgi:hypothetical protein